MARWCPLRTPLPLPPPDGAASAVLVRARLQASDVMEGKREEQDDGGQSIGEMPTAENGGMQEGGRSALALAAACGATDLVRLLLDSGDDPRGSRWSAASTRRVPPLFYAAAADAAPIVRLLARAALRDRTGQEEREGAGVRVVDDREHTMEEEQPQQGILARFSNQIDAFGRTALHYAVDCNAVAAARTLLAYGADAAQADHSGAAPLLYVRSPQMLDALLEGGRGDALLSCTDARGYGLLHYIAARCDGEMVTTACCAGACVEAVAAGSYGETPLLLALRLRRYEVAAQLIAEVG